MGVCLLSHAKGGTWTSKCGRSIGQPEARSAMSGFDSRVTCPDCRGRSPEAKMQTASGRARPVKQVKRTQKRRVRKKK